MLEKFLIILSGLLILIANTNYLFAKQETDEFLIIKQEIDTAYYSFDKLLLEKLLFETEQLKEKYSNSWLPNYYSGILCLQIGKILYNTDSDLAYKYFEQSLDYFQNAIVQDSSAELFALISEVYGKLSSLSTLSAVYYGIKAKTKIIEADKLDNDNPKVMLIGAIHLMHTPKIFGGDKNWAERLLKKSLLIVNKNKKTDKYLINWGQKAEIYAYLAQLEILRANKSKAKNYMNFALKLLPDFGFVKYDLARQLKEIE